MSGITIKQTSSCRNVSGQT